MIITAVGALLFGAAWAAWTGSSLALEAASVRGRVGGVVLMLAGIVGVLYGVRLLAS